MGMNPSRCRVVLRTMGTARAPGGVLAIVEEPTNLGASTYFNAPGEMYFTLRSDHPQAGQIEPWRVHYQIEELVGATWTARYNGLVIDFDANENDIVFYGMDYLGLLDRVIDTRYVEASPEAAPPTGSKHVSQTISSIIANLVDYSKAKQYSPVAFITRGAFDTFSEKVTIFSTFVAVGAFIQGLVESHRQGTGRRSRFWPERTSSTAFRWRLADNPGANRDGIRLTYGGLVNGFNIIGFGQWGTKAHGIGRTQQGAKLYYRSATSPGLDLNRYGSIEVVDFHDNVADANDLQRRVKQQAASAGRVGKRIAMGIKVDGIRPFDGYNIADSVIVDIKRGVIDTKRYGSGYWTIMGVEWRVFPDGHDEVTLVVLPKEDGVAPNPDLLVDQEVLPPSVAVPPGSIDSGKIAADAITEDHITQGAVTNDELADLSVSTPKLEDNAIVPIKVNEGAITAEKINAEGIPGDLITSGDIRVGVIEGNPDTLVVYDSEGEEIGRWGSEGLLISDPHNPDYLIRLSHGELEFSSDGGITYTTAISSEGITADAIKLGTFPGGMNRIPNSGFEMAAFSAPLTKVWTLAADWGTTIGTDVNISKSTDDLKLTTF
jgi:hypothetical protein